MTSITECSSHTIIAIGVHVKYIARFVRIVQMIAGATASTDNRVHEEEFACLYLDDICDLDDTDDQVPYY